MPWHSLSGIRPPEPFTQQHQEHQGAGLAFLPVGRSAPRCPLDGERVRYDPLEAVERSTVTQFRLDHLVAKSPQQPLHCVRQASRGPGGPQAPLQFLQLHSCLLPVARPLTQQGLCKVPEV